MSPKPSQRLKQKPKAKTLRGSSSIAPEPPAVACIECKVHDDVPRTADGILLYPTTDCYQGEAAAMRKVPFVAETDRAQVSMKSHNYPESRRRRPAPRKK